MWDLVIPFGLLTVLTFASLLSGLRVAGRCSQRRTFVVGAVVLGALLVFIVRYHGTWQMVRLLPISGVIILGNWIPLGGAFLAGIALGQEDSPRWRRSCLAGLILLVSGYSVVCCFQGRLPTHGLCSQGANPAEQSWPSSCGPCCAATLLRHHGIPASEEEMLSLCLTSYRGCPALGLYRGLKLKTAGTGWDIQVVTCTVEELTETDGPLLLRVWLPISAPCKSLEPGPENRRWFGHAVLMLGTDHRGYVRIFDPAMRNEEAVLWPIEDMHTRWQGEALRLVRHEH